MEEQNNLSAQLNESEANQDEKIVYIEKLNAKVKWLTEEKANYEIFNNYAKNLFEQTLEIFSGPESLREEIADFLTVFKLLKYKIASQHPVLTKIISNLPR